jgi:23S rRNA (cytosine1962-C5)-methyltransferase
MMNQSPSLSREKLDLLARAAAARLALIDSDHLGALRLFNGFYEGIPGLVADLYGRTLVLANHAASPETLQPWIQAARVYYLERLPWLQAALVKTRRAATREERRGRLVYGQAADERILEGGVWYAIDLQLNQDASFYLDTRNLRAWLRENLRGRSLLNTFAYTGSLGAAALAGGARQVVQTDRSGKFLALTRKTYALNGFDWREGDFPVGDFHRVVGALKREGRLFDCVVLDPPFFSVTDSGRVDLTGEMSRLVNKVRPLVAHQGWLVAVNNALYVSGEAYLAELNNLCQDGYLHLEAILPVPADVTGYAETRVNPPPVDPAPFNHPTKIAVMRVTRKDMAAAR